MEQRISFKESLLPPLYFIVVLWLIHLFQQVTGFDLGYWGTYPRETLGLRGIIFAPLLHGDWAHLASNSFPFMVMMVMIIYFYPRVALRAFLILYFITGLLVWLFARTGVFHIGLSYVVYGLVSFVFWTGVFRRSMRSIVLALFIVTFYSGMIAGVIPSTEILQKNISWDSHLIGGIMGVFVAYFFKEELEDDEKEKQYFVHEDKKPYFASDIFDKTLAQRRWEEEELIRLQEEERMRRMFPPFDGWTSNSTF